jgi:hypothetical protein
MKTNEILLFVGGVALGYLASTMNYGRRTAKAVGDLATGVVVDVQEVAVDTVKMAKCEKNLSEALMTVKLEAGAMDSFKKQFLADCMAR